MNFHSLTFLLFFATVLAACRLLAHRPQNLFLLAASYVFYGWWDWRFLALLAGTTVVDWLCGLRIGAWREQGRVRAVRRLVWLSALVHLGVLGTFKYLGFFTGEMAALLGSLGITVSPLTLEIVLPVGVSFYTFQSLGYVIDVARGRTAPARRLDDLALFVAFFPQLVAGPVERAAHLLPQIARPRVIGLEHLRAGLWLILLGYFKKCVVADNLAGFMAEVRGGAGSLSGGEALAAFYVAAVWMYADFSGYSDIARGTASWLGFDLSANFRRPLFAANPPEFWQRWHITMSQWFRDYVYLPLTRLRARDARGGPWLIACATVTLLLCGLWHGAGWNFVAFGGIHAGLLIGYYAIRPALGWLRRSWPGPAWIPALLIRVLSWHLMAAPTLVFVLPDPSSWLALAQSVWRGVYDGAMVGPLLTLALFGLPLVVLDLMAESKRDDLMILQWRRPWRWAAALSLWAAILLAGAVETHEFVYFQF